MPRTSQSSRAPVAVCLALIGGFLAAWPDRGAKNVQGPVLILMWVNFALTLPGATAPWIAATASVGGMIVASGVAVGNWNMGMLVGIVPAIIAGFGGSFMGGLLDTTAARIDGPRDDPRGSAIDRESLDGLGLGPDHLAGEASSQIGGALTTRAVLGCALIAIAVIGFPLVTATLRDIEHPPARWLAAVWQTVTLLFWIVLCALFVRGRNPDGNDRPMSFTGADALRHIITLLSIAVVHAAGIVVSTAVLFIPVVPDAATLAAAAFSTYLPLDCLAYVSVLTLAYVSDARRQRRDAERAVAALRAESMASRMSALRARLNPHFLFNALNGVSVLARAGDPERTVSLIDGLTGLLRYVLDDRRETVPLSDELAFVRDYFVVQSTRFGERLQTSIEVGSNIDGAFVPQLILQPLVENSVEHGVSASLDGGRVVVRAHRDDDMLVLEVDDDGPTTYSADKDDGIGLPHTRERLARLYGGRASLRIAPRPDRGTRVTVRMPLVVRPT